MDFRFVLCLWCFYLCSVKDTTNGDVPKQYYRISMVSSQDNPGNPALFVHGASPVWDQEQQSLFFVDVGEGKVLRLDYASGKIYSKHIGYGEVNVVALVMGSHRLAVAVRSSLYLLDWATAGDAALRLITTVDLGLPDNVINEGKPDAEGRFWAGTKGPQIGEDVMLDKASLYRIDQEGFTSPKVVLRPISVANGLVWSLNNTLMYFIDSSTQKIDAFDFDLSRGEIGGRRTIFDIAAIGYEDAIPDGMTIDEKGNLWVALMYGSTVLHIDPDTQSIIFAYKLPVSRVTSLCWGGPQLDELFVTTARGSTEPLGGALFTIRDTGSKGIPSNYFKFNNADFY